MIRQTLVRTTTLLGGLAPLTRPPQTRTEVPGGSRPSPEVHHPPMFSEKTADCSDVQRRRQLVELHGLQLLQQQL